MSLFKAHYSVDISLHFYCAGLYMHTQRHRKLYRWLFLNFMMVLEGKHCFNSILLMENQRRWRLSNMPKVKTWTSIETPTRAMATVKHTVSYRLKITFWHINSDEVFLTTTITNLCHFIIVLCFSTI